MKKAFCTLLCVASFLFIKTGRAEVPASAAGVGLRACSDYVCGHATPIITLDQDTLSTAPDTAVIRTTALRNGISSEADSIGVAQDSIGVARQTVSGTIESRQEDQKKAVISDPEAAKTGVASAPTPAADSTTVRETVPEEEKKVPFWRAPYPSSTMALICSIIPGGGQIYNKRYWKAPIVWTALAGSAYVISLFQSAYNEYHTAYADLLSDDPMSKDSWKAFVPYGGNPEDYLNNGSLEGQLERGVKENKSNRDLSILVGVVLYLLSALDAYVDAELYYFDMNPDLSIHIGPVVSAPTPYTPSQAGVGCTIYF